VTFPFVPPARETVTQGGSGWLVSFTDLVCLMLTFFVMLYAMSEPDARRMADLSATLMGRIVPRADGEDMPSAAFNAMRLDRGKAIDLGYLGNIFQSQITASPELSGLVLTRREGVLVLALPADLLFAPGSASLSETGRHALFVLGGVAANIGNALDVIGHTDPSPAGAAWPSNWELSLARAQSVAMALKETGYLRPITVRGQGDAHFEEVAPWLPRGERMRLARRVDLVIREHGSAS